MGVKNSNLITKVFLGPNIIECVVIVFVGILDRYRNRLLPFKYMQNSDIEGMVWALDVSTIIKLKTAKKTTRKIEKLANIAHTHF